MENPKGSPTKYHNGAELGAVAATGDGPVLYMPMYELASRPAAADFGGGMAVIKDGSSYSLQYSTGSAWVSVAGATGPQGAQGAQGAQGPQGEPA